MHEEEYAGERIFMEPKVQKIGFAEASCLKQKIEMHVWFHNVVQLN